MSTLGQWRRSSFCSDKTCLEVETGDEIMIRNAATPDEPPTKATREEWSAFILGVKAGEFDI